MHRVMIGVVATVLLIAVTVTADDISVENVKCLISGAPAQADKSIDYKDGKLFFCCNNCPSAFDAEDESMVIKANHQLVATKQYEQKGCPMSGGPVTQGTEVTIAGATVGFCCTNCKAKVESAEDAAAKMKLVFSNEAFKKAFQKKSAAE